jgi:hypothetical protein
MAGALDGDRQCALMFGASTGLSARSDLAVIGDVTAQHFNLLVIDGGILVRAELALAWASEKPPLTWAALAFIIKSLIAHVLTPRDL